MWEALAALLAIAAMLLREYLAAMRETDDHEADNQAFDQALAAGDADALSVAFERLREPTGDGDPGGPDDPPA